MRKIPFVQEEAILSPETSLGTVHFIVNDLKKQIDFYKNILRMKIFKEEEGYAALGSENQILLELTEDKEAKRIPASTGLYHFALLYPSEEDLARIIYSLIEARYPNSPTDHAMSKTTYLKDAEGNEIELYVRTLDRADMV